jgi:hypothetical protein
MDLHNLRKKFEAEEAPVPSDAWSRLEASLDKKTPRSPLMWWLGAILLFIAAGLGISKFANSNETTIAQTNTDTNKYPVATKTNTQPSDIALVNAKSNANSNKANQELESPKSEQGTANEGKEVTTKPLPINLPTANNGTKGSSNSETGTSNGNINQGSDYVRNNPSAQQGNSNTGRNRRTITTVIGGHRNRVLRANNEENTATGTDRLPADQIATTVPNKNRRTTTRTTNPVTSSVNEGVADNTTNNGSMVK